MKLQILGHDWNMTVLRKSTMDRKHGTRTAGITMPDVRKIEIRDDFLGLPTIIHELSHAYLSEMPLVEVGLSAEQFEELFCELMQKYGQTIIHQATEAYHHLSSQRKEKSQK